MIKVTLTNQILKYITEIDKNRYNVSSIKLSKSVANKLRKNSKKKSSYASNKIEGNPLSEQQVDEVIESDERNICKITSGEVQYSIIGTSADEYPDIPEVSAGFPIVINQALLKDMIRKTIFSVSTSERNPVHSGVRFEIGNGKIILVAVDGARLAVRREDIDYDGENGR